LNLTNAIFRDDFRPIEETCECYACRTFSRAYLRHLFQAQEILAMRLGSLHNLHFYHQLMEQMRQAIAGSNFTEWKRNFFEKYQTQPNGSFAVDDISETRKEA
jgi:queuine tRNA-ribosyltransferase